MKVEILVGCYVDGNACKVGDIVETKSGNLLIGMNKAVIAKDKPKKVKAPMNKKVDDFEVR